MDIVDEISLETTAAEDWETIRLLFPARHAMKPSEAWINGLSSRLASDRISRLLKGSAVGALAAMLDQCSDGRLKALRTYAAVNLEQAMSAFRMTIIANISAPIVLLSIAHQLIDGGMGRFLARIHGGDEGLIIIMIIGSVTAALILLFVMIYALANLNQARDIRHLMDLLGADRGIYFGLEDAEDLHSP